MLGLLTAQSSFANQLTILDKDSAQVYLDSTGGSTTYGGEHAVADYQGNQVMQFGWFPPGNGWGPHYRVIRAVVTFDLTTIPSGQYIDSAILNSSLVTTSPGFLVRFEPANISGQVWNITGGTAFTTGLIDTTNSASNDWLDPATLVGTIYPTNSNPTGAPFQLDVTNAIRSLYTTGQHYAAFQWRIFSETSVQTDSTNGYYYSTGDGPDPNPTDHSFLTVSYASTVTGIPDWQKAPYTDDMILGVTKSQSFPSEVLEDKPINREEK